MRHAAVYLFLGAKAADYVTTFTGLRMGFTEMSAYAATPIGFAMIFAVVGALLFMEWVIGRYELGFMRWLPYAVAGVEWLAVPWNLHVIGGY